MGWTWVRLATAPYTLHQEGRLIVTSKLALRMRRSLAMRARPRPARVWSLLVVLIVLASGALSGCTTYHGALTVLGHVDEFPVGRWSPSPAVSQARIGLGIYPIPAQHLILIHILIPDTAVASLGPGAVHGAVGVWWVALDDRAPRSAAHVGALVYLPTCVSFKTYGTGAQFDIAGEYLDGPSPASLSRYPLSFNPEDGSVSVALSPQDEIAVPRGDQSHPSTAALWPAPNVQCPPDY